MKDNFNFLLHQNFYKKNLVVVTEKKNSSFESFGNYQKALIILISKEENNNNVDFLRKILAAIKFDLDVDALRIVSSQGDIVSFPQIKKEFIPKTIISFGIDAKQLDIQITVSPYTPLNIDGTRLLFVDNLNEIQSNRQKKGALWTQLQEIFLS